MRFFAALTDLFALSFFSFFNGGGFFRFRSRLLSRSLARRELWLRGFEQRFGKIVLAGLQLLLFYTVYGKQKLVSWHDAVGVEAVFSQPIQFAQRSETFGIGGLVNQSVAMRAKRRIV